MRYFGLRTSLGALVLAALTVLGAIPASATSQAGSWWTGVLSGGPCASVGVTSNQGHYQNTGTAPNVSTRGDGYNVHTLAGNYIRKIIITEKYNSGLVEGTRTWTFTGTATSSSITGVPTSLMPWMVDDPAVGVKLVVTTYTSIWGDLACNAEFTIGQG